MKKNVNTQISMPSAYSNDVYERFAAFILDANTASSLFNRYRAFRRMCANLNEGDTFIADTFEGIFPSNMCMYADTLADRYDCDFIKIVTRGGEVVRNSNGLIIAKSTCNVYRFNADPDTMSDALDLVRQCIMRKLEG